MEGYANGSEDAGGRCWIAGHGFLGYRTRHVLSQLGAIRCSSGGRCFGCGVLTSRRLAGSGCVWVPHYSRHDTRTHARTHTHTHTHTPTIQNSARTARLYGRSLPGWLRSADTSPPSACDRPIPARQQRAVAGRNTVLPSPSDRSAGRRSDVGGSTIQKRAPVSRVGGDPEVTYGSVSEGFGDRSAKSAPSSRASPRLASPRLAPLNACAR